MKFINSKFAFKPLFREIRRPKIQEKLWIKLPELNKYTNLVLWLTTGKDYHEEYVELMSRIKRLVKRSGWNFAFLYLKESLRLIIQALGGSPEFVSPGKGLLVKRDKFGLPTILPGRIRKHLFSNWQSDQSSMKALLTLVSSFRVFPTKPSVKLDTIIGPFTGFSKSVQSDISGAVYEIFGRKRLMIKDPALIFLESSGPNSKLSSWSSGYDALAFLHEPMLLVSYWRYMFNFGKIFYAWWITFIILVLGIPYYILFLFGKIKYLVIGKLGVVLDQAGKARVIGITSYWIQLALKPLHDSLFKVVRSIDQDGTFDQEKPLDLLISRDSSEKFYCFDLSAATDRLPIDIQEQILNIASKSNLGTLWRALLNFSWRYKNEFFKYSVGQPMGAYSSWAMLAITHHVIVRYCALSIGIKNFDSYAVLGDDIVIRDKLVAEQYLIVMKVLGVDINMTKSLVSPSFAEFAKKWKGPNVDLTPVGPGLILQAIRSKSALAMLIIEAFKRHLITSLPQLLEIQKRIADPFCIFWSTIIAESFIKDITVDGETPITAGVAFSKKQFNLLASLDSTLRREIIREWDSSILKAKLEIERFFKTWFWKSLYKKVSWSVRGLELLLRCLGPSYWIYTGYYTEIWTKLGMNPLSIEAGFPPYMDTFTSIRYIIQTFDPILSVPTLDVSDRKRVKEFNQKIKKIRLGLQKNPFWGLSFDSTYKSFIIVGAADDDLSKFFGF